MISSAYDPFLSRFPLCHWYWSQYAYHIVRISLNPHKGAEIFEKALHSAMYSLGLWIDYCRFATAFYDDKLAVSRLFRMGIMFVGKGYLSHALWDLYINHEHSRRNWSSLASIYLQVLRYPTEKLHKYYAIFIKFAAGMVEEIKRRRNNGVEPEGGVQHIGTTTFSQREISKVIEDLQNPSDEALRAEAVQKYKFFGDQFYQKACELDDRIKGFENNIRHRYFDMTPLDDEELKNWHMYLDCVEKQDDFLWALQLYERCLISCANYPEFWMRYVEYLDSKGGRELANFALERAEIFLKGVPEMHLFNARYKERIGDATGARTAFFQFDEKPAAYLTKHVIELANMERRLGNLEEAYDIFEKAITMAEEKMQWHSCSTLFMHLSRLKYTITRSANAARDVLIDGIRRVPSCRLLLEELIKFAMMHQEAMPGNLLDSIIADAISARSKASQSLASKDREDISVYYLEYVDLCGTVDDVRKARNRHLHLFPHLVRDSITYKRLELGNHVPSGIVKQREESPGVCNLQIEDQPNKTENMVQERKQQPDFQVLKQYRETPAEVNLSSNSAKQAGEDKSESMKVTSAVVDLSCQDASEPNALDRKSAGLLTSNGLIDASQGLSISIIMPEQESLPMICGEQDVTLDISQSDRNSKQNDVIPNSIPPQDSPSKTEDFAKVHKHSHDNELMSSSSSANNQEHTPAGKHINSAVILSGDCFEKNQTVSFPFSQGETSEVPRHSDNEQNRHHHMASLQHSQTVVLSSAVQTSPQHHLQTSVPSKSSFYPEEANSMHKQMLTDKIQKVNDKLVQSPGTSQWQASSPNVPYAQMSDVSQPMACSDGNYGSQSQMWQYYYQQQQQQFLQQQYQLQLYQSMQLKQQQYLWQSQLQSQQHTQEQQPSPLQQNQYTMEQSQVPGPLSSNPYQQQQHFPQAQQHYQLVTQQAEHQDHQQEIVADGVHQKGHEQHVSQSYQLLWQQYQQQAYMLQQQQQYLQYTYNQLTGQLPPQQQNQPLAHGEEYEEKQNYQQSSSDQDI